MIRRSPVNYGRNDRIKNWNWDNCEWWHPQQLCYLSETCLARLRYMFYRQKVFLSDFFLIHILETKRDVDAAGNMMTTTAPASTMPMMWIVAMLFLAQGAFCHFIIRNFARTCTVYNITSAKCYKELMLFCMVFPRSFFKWDKFIHSFLVPSLSILSFKWTHFRQDLVRSAHTHTGLFQSKWMSKWHDAGVKLLC